MNPSTPPDTLIRPRVVPFWDHLTTRFKQLGLVPHSGQRMDLKTATWNCLGHPALSCATKGAGPYLGPPQDIRVASTVRWGLELPLLEPSPRRSEDTIGASPRGTEDACRTSATRGPGQDRRQVPDYALLEIATQRDLIVKVEVARRRLFLRGTGHGERGA